MINSIPLTPVRLNVKGLIGGKVELVALADKIYIGLNNYARTADIPLTITDFYQINKYMFHLDISGLVNDAEPRIGERLDLTDGTFHSFFTVVSYSGGGATASMQVKKLKEEAINVADILANYTLTLKADNYIEFGTSINNTVINTTDVEYLYLVAATGPTDDNLVIREFPF